jgi:hypothetical protein
VPAPAPPPAPSPAPPAHGSPATRGHRWKRRLGSAFTERLALKGTALLLALVLWFIVSAKEPAEEIIAIRFQPSFDPSLQLVGELPTIRALVVGSGRELLKLYSSPPTIRRSIGEDVPDTLELNLRPEDVDLPPGVEAIVRGVEPRRVTLVFAAELAKRVPVRSGLRLEADSLERFDPVIRFDPDSVRVTGPRRTVARISAVHTMPITITAADSTIILAPLDTTELGRARVRPGSVFAQVIWHSIPPAVPAEAPVTAPVSAPIAPRPDSGTIPPAP